MNTYENKNGFNSAVNMKQLLRWIKEDFDKANKNNDNFGVERTKYDTNSWFIIVNKENIAVVTSNMKSFPKRLNNLVKSYINK